jgi:hypothetical protein
MAPPREPAATPSVFRRPPTSLLPSLTGLETPLSAHHSAATTPPYTRTAHPSSPSVPGRPRSAPEPRRTVLHTDARSFEATRSGLRDALLRLALPLRAPRQPLRALRPRRRFPGCARGVLLASRAFLCRSRTSFRATRPHLRTPRPYTRFICTALGESRAVLRVQPPLPHRARSIHALNR